LSPAEQIHTTPGTVLFGGKVGAISGREERHFCKPANNAMAHPLTIAIEVDHVI